MSDAVLQTEFEGRRWRLFWLALRTSLLTVLTLGFYRFWMKTRLRRYYWSSIRPGGLALEYVGLPSEKLRGFLVAVVLMAFYIGVVNLILMFLSFTLFRENFAAYLLSFLGVVPLWFFASYRARRYVLARTRWRGIRFGVEPGAWGYMGRALWHWFLAIVTLGLLWPRKTFWLEKYRTDRTYFGTQPLHQTGHWSMLLTPFLPLIAGLWLIAAAMIAGEVGGDDVVVGAMAIVGIQLAVLGWVYFRVQSFRRLTNAKTGGELALIARPRYLRVLWIYGCGWFLIGLLLTLTLGSLGLIVGMVGGLDTTLLQAERIAELTRNPAVLIGSAILYFSGFIFFGVFRHVFLTMPLMRHFAETLEIGGIPALDQVGQRARDEFTEAEGFADALDVGGAI